MYKIVWIYDVEEKVVKRQNSRFVVFYDSLSPFVLLIVQQHYIIPEVKFKNENIRNNETYFNNETLAFYEKFRK